MHENDDDSPFVDQEKPDSLIPHLENTDSATQWGEGAGPFGDVVNCIVDADDPLSLTFAVDVVTTGLDVLGFMEDPFGGLVKAGLGWLIEHISWLKTPLDVAAGDPDAITAKANTWTQIAAKLDMTAQAYAESVAGMNGFEGEAAQSYRDAVRGYNSVVQLASSHAINASRAMNIGAMLVGGFRGTVRDGIVDFCYDRAVKFFAASALAPVSFGATEAVFITDSVVEGSVLAGKNVKKANQLINDLEKLSNLAKKSQKSLNTGSGHLGKKLAGHVDDVAKHNSSAIKHVTAVKHSALNAGKRVERAPELNKAAKGLQKDANKLSREQSKLNDLERSKGLAQATDAFVSKFPHINREVRNVTATPFSGRTVERIQEVRDKLPDVPDSPVLDGGMEAAGQLTYDDKHRQEDDSEKVKEREDHWHGEGHLW